jgi:hypothetical protein
VFTLLGVAATSLGEVNGSFDPGALLGASYSLAHGGRVRLRLLAVSDTPALRALVRAQGHDPDELRWVRLRHYHPRREVVLCALAAERLVGIGAMPIDASAPALLVADEAAAPGVTELLSGALTGRAQSLVRLRTAA